MPGVRHAARRWALAVLLALLALGAAGCGEEVGPEVSSQEINLYLWREYTPPELISAFEDEFGVTANVSYYENNQDMIDGVEANPGRYDLVIPSDYAVDIMRRKELLEPIDVYELPNFEHIEDRFKRPVFDPGSIDEQTPGVAARTSSRCPTPGARPDSSTTSGCVRRPVRRWADLFGPSSAARSSSSTTSACPPARRC